MNDLIERIRQIIDHHGKDDRADDAGRTCGCGATRLSDHSRHVAEAFVTGLSSGHPADRSRDTNVVDSPAQRREWLTRSTGMAAYIAHSSSHQSGLSTDQKDGDYDGSGRHNMG
jgi:hypothetical protein